MTRRFLLLVAVALAPPLGAQDSSAVRLASGLPVGVRIRTSSFGAQPEVHIGTFAGITGDTLRLRPLGGAADTSLLLANIARLDRSVGDRTLGLQGGGIGLALGFATGMIVGLASGTDRQSDMPMSGWQKGLLFGVPLGLVGGVIGGVAGRSYHTDRWQPINVPGRTGQ